MQCWRVPADARNHRRIIQACRTIRPESGQQFARREFQAFKLSSQISFAYGRTVLSPGEESSTFRCSIKATSMSAWHSGLKSPRWMRPKIARVAAAQSYFGGRPAPCCEIGCGLLSARSRASAPGIPATSKNTPNACPEVQYSLCPRLNEKSPRTQSISRSASSLYLRFDQNEAGTGPSLKSLTSSRPKGSPLRNSPFFARALKAALERRLSNASSATARQTYRSAYRPL